jgi:hypothetical protein
VLSSLAQNNEVQLRKDGATAYLDKSTPSLQEHSESLVQVVKRILDGRAECAGHAASLLLALLVRPVEGGI